MVRIQYVPTEEHRRYHIGRMIEKAVPKRSALVRYFKTYVLSTIVVAAGIYYLWRSSGSGSWLGSLAVVTAGGLVVLPLIETWGRKLKAKELVNRLLEERDNGSFAVELRTDGLWIDDSGTQSLIPWRRISCVRDMPDYIEFEFGEFGLTVVAKEAFSSREDARQFLDHARRLASH